jgi:hypothetical protein
VFRFCYTNYQTARWQKHEKYTMIKNPQQTFGLFMKLVEYLEKILPTPGDKKKPA